MFRADGLQWSQMSFFLKNFNEFLSPSDLSQGSLEVVWVYGIDYLLHMTSESVLISWGCLLRIFCGCSYLYVYVSLIYFVLN